MENTNITPRLLSCTRCGETKSEDEFHKRPDKKRGRHYHCKSCNSKYTTTDAARVRGRVKSKRCRDKIKATDPEKYKRQWRAWNLKKFYNLTIDDYNEMLAAQNGTCAICFQPPGNTNFHVDHNHSSGKIRGLLCSACNTAIGLLNENPEILKSALAYLDRHSD